MSFRSIVTYGNITMFSPLLTEKDLFNSLDKMLRYSRTFRGCQYCMQSGLFVVLSPDVSQQTTGTCKERNDHERTRRCHFDAKCRNACDDVAGNGKRAK